MKLQGQHQLDSSVRYILGLQYMVSSATETLLDIMAKLHI